MRILVIEDERTLAAFIEQSLRAEGYAVTKHATVVIAKAGHAVVTTRSSGGQTGVSTGSTAPARAPAPVTTRAS